MQWSRFDECGRDRTPIQNSSHGTRQAFLSLITSVLTIRNSHPPRLALSKQSPKNSPQWGGEWMPSVGFCGYLLIGVPTTVRTGRGISITCDVDHAGHAGLLLISKTSALSGWELRPMTMMSPEPPLTQLSGISTDARNQLMACLGFAVIGFAFATTGVGVRQRSSPTSSAPRSVRRPRSQRLGRTHPPTPDLSLRSGSRRGTASRVGQRSRQSVPGLTIAPWMAGFHATIRSTVRTGSGGPTIPPTTSPPPP